jgi:ribonuclease P protein subunit POP4
MPGKAEDSGRERLQRQNGLVRFVKRTVPRLDGAAKMLGKGELIGLQCAIQKANDAGIVGLTGEVVDETLHTLTLRLAAGRRVQLAKSGSVFSFLGNQGNWISIEGRAIEFRPEDRPKKVK